MKKEIAEKWVEALRSGKYKQTSGSLKSGDEFCCLGVLCDISNKGKWVVGGYSCNTISFPSENYLPFDVKEWAAIKSPSGTLNVPELIEFDDSSLAYANDQGRTFEEIANIIEKYWEQL